MNTLPLASNLLYKIENSDTLGMFARDTGGCLITRLALSRSKDESREISFAELGEAVIFYFTAGPLARLTRKAISKASKIPVKTLSSPIAELANLSAKELKKVKLGKLGQIGITFSLILPLIYSIAPFKNLLTLAKTGKNDFTSVINLENKKSNTNSKSASKKIHKLIKHLAIAAISGLAFTASTIALSKNASFYKKIEPVLNQVLKRLDLPGKKCDLNNFHFGLLIFPVSIAGYFVACRDKYEVKENARRFAITVPLMFFGEKVITRPIHRLYEKLFKTKIIEDNKNNEFKVLNQLEIKNKNLLEDVEKRMLKAKNCAYATTFLINTFVIASAVSLLNRFATKKSFDKNNSNSKSTQIDNFLTPLKHPDKTT